MIISNDSDGRLVVRVTDPATTIGGVQAAVERNLPAGGQFVIVLPSGATSAGTYLEARNRI